MKSECAIFLPIILAVVTAVPRTSSAQKISPPIRPPLTTPAAPGPGPRIHFEEPKFDFGKVPSGTVVKHEFKLSNAGDQPLEISNVRPSCGCTTAGTWPGRLEPGQSGAIPIQFNTGTFSGPVTKTVVVTCNDSNQPAAVLEIKGTVWKPVEVSPTYALFNVVGDALTNEIRSIRIVNNLEEPLKVSEPEWTNQSFQVELKTLQPGKEFELLITLVQPPASGTVQAPVLMKTSSTNLPLIHLNAIAMVQPAVLVYPTQIILPPRPLPSDIHYTITVRKNGTGALVLSEPAMNAEGVEMKLLETQPGRLFSLMLKFPAGFEIPAGKKVELSVKSDHPRYPLIHVPVSHRTSPVRAMVPSNPAPRPIVPSPGTRRQAVPGPASPPVKDSR